MTAPIHDDTLLALIEERADLATGDLLAVLERVRKRVAAMSLTAIQGPALARLVDEVLAAMGIAARAAVRAGSDKDAVAEQLASRQERMERAARDLQTTERPSLARALLLLRPATALATVLRGGISDHLVGAQTEQRRKAAQRGNQVAMWVPERDACVRCLRMAGLRLLRPADQFPAGLTYDPAGTKVDGTVPGPPLHPHCRCELQLVNRGDSEEASAALRREADRSIFKGWALESESSAARRRAASALLASGVQAPKSVKAEARRRLRDGEPFIRGVPGGA